LASSRSDVPFPPSFRAEFSRPAWIVEYVTRSGTFALGLSRRCFPMVPARTFSFAPRSNFLFEMFPLKVNAPLSFQELSFAVYCCRSVRSCLRFLSIFLSNPNFPRHVRSRSRSFIASFFFWDGWFPRRHPCRSKW